MIEVSSFVPLTDRIVGAAYLTSISQSNCKPQGCDLVLPFSYTVRKIFQVPLLQVKLQTIQVVSQFSLELILVLIQLNV